MKSRKSNGRVTGIGGVFFKSKNPGKLKRWYIEKLGIVPDKAGYVVFRWGKGTTTWHPFDAGTKYFGRASQQSMINYRVDDLDALLARLKRARVKVDPRIEEFEYGRFAWATDPEGNRFELWEPAKGW